MILDLPNIPEQAMPNFKGGEGTAWVRMFFDGQNRIMLGRLPAGASIGMHTHDTNSEIIYFLSGKGSVLYDGERFEVEAGQCHYCPKGHSHSLINNGDEDLVFFAVVPNQ